jgi:hypothetical protein
MGINSPVTQVVSFASSDGFVVTPSDTTKFTKNARILYVGVSGDLSILTPAGTSLVFKSVPVGFFYMAASRVNAAGTTATNIIGLV